MDPQESRNQFLMSMYAQMWNNTTRHITLVWQPVTVIFTIIGALLAAEFQHLGYFLIAILIFIVYLVIGWFIAHVYDSSNWVNRNLSIITNIERQFLIDGDEKEIHFYHTLDNKNRDMIDHFKIQYLLGIFLGIAVTVYYIGKFFYNNYWFPDTTYIPALGIIISFFYVIYVRNRCKKSFERLVVESPGKKI